MCAFASGDRNNGPVIYEAITLSFKVYEVEEEKVSVINIVDYI